MINPVIRACLYRLEYPQKLCKTFLRLGVWCWCYTVSSGSWNKAVVRRQDYKFCDVRMDNL